MMDVLSYALDIGYRHIDTAHFYRVEPEVWQHFHREADVEVSLRGSLQRMNLDYVDMVLVHWPMSITANKIVVVAYSPFGTMVPSRTAPSSPEPKLNNPTMLAIADKYKKTVSQIALNYLSRVLENASIFDFTLEARDVETLATFECAYRFVRPIFWQDYNNYPFEKVPEKMEIPLGLRKWKDGCN
ncbi:Aldo-ketose reductase 1 [Operophtera brumata]|uniref:Aldo-ketose reductase 1 n=1 Tax=Operophtera brumata TaxID=104452 RepID=A0A0L7LL79_OPEBR|nr:Aldo-ketose reductase 1 [Operophtera brumata]